MTEETNIKEAVEEIKNANEDELKKVIQGWYERTHTHGLKLGASYISAAIYGVIKQHTKKPGKVSLNDYRRMTDEIVKIIAVQLVTEQNDSEENVMEENENDGTTESNDNTNS